MPNPSSSAPQAPALRLYSQTPYDDRGNFHYEGDLYNKADDLPTLCRKIERHLAEHFPAASFTIRSERFSLGRKVTAEVLDTPTDLTSREAQQAFIVLVRDQMFTRANPLQDFWSCAFYAEVKIGRPYWTALAARRGKANPVEPLVSLGAFKKRLKSGDRLRLIHGPAGHPALGKTREIMQVRSKDFVFEGRSFCDFPRASNFACDGHRVRIAIGSEYEPDAHLLYEWHPKAA